MFDEILKEIASDPYMYYIGSEVIKNPTPAGIVEYYLRLGTSHRKLSGMIDVSGLPEEEKQMLRDVLCGISSIQE